MIVLYCFSPLKTPVISLDILLPKAIFIFVIFKSNMTALLNFQILCTHFLVIKGSLHACMLSLRFF